MLKVVNRCISSSVLSDRLLKRSVTIIPAKTTTDLEQSVSKQTEVSTGLAAHLLLSEKCVNKNVVFSPASIHGVLSLLAAGSKGPTLDQLLAFLKAKNIDELNSLSSQLVSAIFARRNTSGGPCLFYANGVWVDKTLLLKPSFKQVVKTVYKATCKKIDFKDKANEVVREVNLWAKEQTKGLIKNAIPVQAVDMWTRLIFANAVYFKAAWYQQFHQSLTTECDFYLLDGNDVEIPFMTNNQVQFISHYDGFSVARLPYLRGRDRRHFSMYFFLPQKYDGLHSLVEKMKSTPCFFDRHIPRQEVKVRNFWIPKFKISFAFEASDVLKELGLVLPFEVGDGLDEMVDSSVSQLLYVSSIYQKSFVEVNDKVTEAVMVTETDGMWSCSMPIEAKRTNFIADHPFLFVIREDVTGVVLFIGQVTDPSID